MWYAKIDRDYLTDSECQSKVGTAFHDDLSGEIEPDHPKLRWRLLDDDRRPYFGGWLQEVEDKHAPTDPWQDILDWGTWYAGCTIIQQRQGDTWEDVIG